ncbi:MAG: hypothetical protein Q8L46_00885 [candidate division WWE3 bacterium]|nr:hypothetical protein [candidate division WWE3 bacterium]
MHGPTEDLRIGLPCRFPHPESPPDPESDLRQEPGNFRSQDPLDPIPLDCKRADPRSHDKSEAGGALPNIQNEQAEEGIPVAGAVSPNTAKLIIGYKPVFSRKH